MLSHSKGFFAMNQKYNMPFDGTQNDIIVNASLPETRDSCFLAGSDEKIGRLIDGTVVQEDDTFYVLKKDGRKIDFLWKRKVFGNLVIFIWKLVRNGLLEKDSILLWDEPEANLNPELYPLVAEILLNFAGEWRLRFYSGHSYNFAKYLEIRRKEKSGNVP